MFNILSDLDTLMHLITEVSLYLPSLIVISGNSRQWHTCIETVKLGYCVECE